ncbi:tetratricopeptide repeat protein [Polynucleobacter paneuropaeus]|jgi:predicted O-linked N-acetylglucosamine transferase (SPINDLY family)|nr:tetratricopeptide repeat protein [Polynucleobacter paneuropaeus]
MATMNPQIQLTTQQAFLNGDLDHVSLILNQFLQEEANSTGIVFGLGITYAKANKFTESIFIFNILQAYVKNDERIFYNIGLIYALQGKHELAIENYQLAIKIKPNDSEIFINIASSYIDIKNYPLALDTLDKAIQLRPEITEAWSNKGIALNHLGLYQESLEAYNEAIKLSPTNYEAWGNKSAPLMKLNLFKDALEACETALLLKPNYVEGWTNKGAALHKLDRYEEAITCYDRALFYKPDYFLALSNKGDSLNKLNRLEEAITCCDMALNINPNIDWAYGDLLHMKRKVFFTQNFKEELKILQDGLSSCKNLIAPFEFLSWSDDPSLQKKVSEIFVRAKYPFIDRLGSLKKYLPKDKIRIGYFSADFKNHPVAFLIAELFELHDKSRFETYALSLVRADDEMRGRLLGAFDHFMDVASQSDIEIAKLARELEIDIAIDLSGFTADSRTAIFSYRAAPIQVNWLGYPGTLGADYMDYIIADGTLIPPQSQQFFSEKIVYLPNTYQPNDRKRLVSERQFTRQELGFPENAFVFCCFNNNFKITPATFSSWMRILKAVEGSVLWLLQDNPWVVKNLKQEAVNCGVDEGRLFFAKRVVLSEHLARHRQADLFLDTLPYNAHTTTSDALWAGVPVLTLIGQSFPGRVAASLLNAIGLPELVTTTEQEYEELAIQLASNPQKLLDIKNKLAEKRLSAPLFDTPLFTKNLEAAYIKMYERYQADLEPEHISILN